MHISFRSTYLHTFTHKSLYTIKYTAHIKVLCLYSHAVQNIFHTKYKRFAGIYEAFSQNKGRHILATDCTCPGIQSIT